MAILESKEVIQQLDEFGEVVSTQETTKTTNYKKNTEEEYIKIYTKMICVFQDLPAECAPLMIALASLMSYANAEDTEHFGGQLVGITQLVREQIQQQLGISKATFFKHIKRLEDANIIRKVGGSRSATWQVNPNYFGKGLWEFNPKYGYGGIKDLRATFNFADKTVKTEIEYAKQYMTNQEIAEYHIDPTEYTKTTTKIDKNTPSNFDVPEGFTATEIDEAINNPNFL